jgi:hypothetical protein
VANTEVGTAWVTIIPSAKGFAKELQKAIAKEFKGSNLDRMISDALGDTRVKMPVEPVVDKPEDLEPLKVPVEPEKTSLTELQETVQQTADDVKAWVAVGPDGTTFGRQLQDVVDQAEENVTAEVDVDVDTEPAGEPEYERGLRSMVSRVAQRVRATIRADVEVDKPSLDRLHTKIDAEVGRKAGGKIGDDAGRGFLSSFGSAIRNATGVSPWLIVAGTAIGAAMLPAITAAITGGLLGGAGLGLIGLGALILREQPDVAAAAERLAFTVSTQLRGVATPLIDPLVKAMETIRFAVVEWGPQFKEMFSLIAPAIQPLTEGLIGFVSNVLPGVVELIREATPFLIRLAGELPKLGEYIGAFFRIIDGGGPEASLFFSDLITVVGLLILAVGVVIRVFTELYPVFRTLVLLSPIGTFLNLIKVVWQTRDAVNSFASQGKEAFQRFSAIVTAIFRSLRNEPEAWVRWIAGIPRRILRALGGLGDLLRGAGRALINGLVGGIRAAIPNLQGVLGWVTNMIPSWKGPEDRDRVLLEPAGQAIMGGLIRGIHGERRSLEAELGSVTALVAGTPLTTPAAGFSAPAAAVHPAAPTIRFAGDAPGSFMAWVRENIRTDYGGDPDEAFATVSR